MNPFLELMYTLSQLWFVIVASSNPPGTKLIFSPLSIILENLFGLTEGHLSFLNAYGNQLFFYPKALLRNLIGYQTYAIKSGRKISKIIADVKNPLIKILGILALPFSLIYQKLK